METIIMNAWKGGKPDRKPDRKPYYPYGFIYLHKTSNQ